MHRERLENRDALFWKEGSDYHPTLYTQGPWDPEAQIGGTPAALFATLVEGRFVLPFQCRSCA